MLKKRIYLCLLALLFITLNSYGRSHHRSHYSGDPWCDTPGYNCMRVHGGDTWYSLFPDDYERGMVMRINHTNGHLYAGMVLKVPNNINSSVLRDHSPLPTYIQSNGEKVIIFSPEAHAWGAYDTAGAMVRWGPATGGADWCKDIEKPCRTKSGTFRIYAVGESNCVSSKFPVAKGGAPMPFCMFFNGDQALHGSPNGVVRDNASHGCVRLFVSDAEWLRYDFVDPPSAYNRYRGTKVIVLPYGKINKYAEDFVTDDNLLSSFEKADKYMQKFSPEEDENTVPPFEINNKYAGDVGADEDGM